MKSTLFLRRDFDDIVFAYRTRPLPDARGEGQHILWLDEGGEQSSMIIPRKVALHLVGREMQSGEIVEVACESS